MSAYFHDRLPAICFAGAFLCIVFLDLRGPGGFGAVLLATAGLLAALLRRKRRWLAHGRQWQSGRGPGAASKATPRRRSATR